MVNWGKEFTGPFSPVQLCKSVGTLLSTCGDTCTHLGILLAGEVEEKEEL